MGGLATKLRGSIRPIAARAAPPAPTPAVAVPGAAAILSALPTPTVVLDGENRFRFANPAAEQFFGLSARLPRGAAAVRPAARGRPPVRPARPRCGRYDAPVSDHDLVLESPRLQRRGVVAAHGAPFPDLPGGVVLTLQDGSTARMLGRQQDFLGAARGASAMAAMLAHEVKNPLSGIRGAAQLLEHGASENDRELCQLIQDEADRIRGLVDRMDMFSDRPVELGPVNIHQVLDHVRRVARTGFAAHLRIVEEYDPSLPLVWGNRDLLVQILLNLVKNAAEAAGPGAGGGEIALDHRLPPRRAHRRARQHGARAPALAGVRARRRAGHPGRGARHAVRALRVHQARRAGARPRAGRQAGGRPGRPDRVRQPARPHRVPPAAAHATRGHGRRRTTGEARRERQPDHPRRRRRPRHPHRAEPGARPLRLPGARDLLRRRRSGAGWRTARATSSSPTW